MNARDVRHLLLELLDENPFAIRAVLRILAVEFTGEVPTMAVTVEERPRLLINLDFVNEHCATPEHVKAVLCHEFLHVLLRHTSVKGAMTPARHLALDAAINAIIHRQCGLAYSSMMMSYYRHARGIARMLRPPAPNEYERYLDDLRAPPSPPWYPAWHGLYAGRVLADDIEQLAEEFAAADGGAGRLPGVDALLGNHEDEADPAASPALEAALERVQREMNGSGIWREAGRGGNPYAALVNAKRAAIDAWRRRTLEVLRRHLQPAPGAPRTRVPVQARLPVLSAADRRAFLRASWSPFLPEAEWRETAERPEGRAQVYLDVSGSMYAEMPLIVGLLGQLSAWIRRPFWAFSTRVAPAVIERGVLRADTTGGTSLACVLEHVERTRPPSAVIVTDGYIEKIDPQRVRGIAATTRLHAIVTRDGNPAMLRSAGIAYSQLGRLPS